MLGIALRAGHIGSYTLRMFLFIFLFSSHVHRVVRLPSSADGLDLSYLLRMTTCPTRCWPQGKSGPAYEDLVKFYEDRGKSRSLGSRAWVKGIGHRVMGLGFYVSTRTSINRLVDSSCISLSQVLSTTGSLMGLVLD